MKFKKLNKVNMLHQSHMTIYYNTMALNVPTLILLAATCVHGEMLKYFIHLNLNNPK